MQSWQIKILKLEQSVLQHLSGFIAQHALAVSIGIIYLVVVLGVCLIVYLNRRQGKWRARPVIFIQTPAPPTPQAETFDPFPPPHHRRDCDCDEED